MTLAALIVSVQVSPPTKSVVGSREKVVGPPLTVAVFAPLTLQFSVNHGSVTLTGSLKVTVTSLFKATSVAPSAGVVLLTVGAASVTHGLRGDAVLRGFGAMAVKSAPLLSVSVQPLPLRSTAVVLLLAGAALPSKKFAPSQPTRSTIWASWAAEHGVDTPLHVRPVAVLTSATLPPVALMLILPVASGVGRATPLAPPLASRTR